MKSRLEPADHTEQDAYAWAKVVLDAPSPAMFGSVLWTRSLMQDRRDADIIYEQMIAYGDIIRPPGYPRYRVWHAAFAFLNVPLPADYCVYD